MSKYPKISSFRILVIFILLSGIGLFHLKYLNIRLNPSRHNTRINISYQWHNATPFLLDQNITSLIENAVSELGGIKKISSRSYAGKGFINIEPGKYTDIDALKFEISFKIRQIRNRLPLTASYPVVSLNSAEEEQHKKELLVYSFYAPKKVYDIKEILQNRLIPFFNDIREIDKIEITGATGLEYVITYRPNLMDLYHISRQDIVKAIKNSQQKYGIGLLKSAKHYSRIIVNNHFDKKMHIPVKNYQGKIIYLDQIAKTGLQEQAPNFYYRINGKNAVNVIFYPSGSTNNLVLADIIKHRMQQAVKKLPLDFEMKKTYDSTAYIKTELHKIYIRTFWVIAILMAFILLTTFNYKYLLISLISLIVNLSIAFLFYYILHLEIQLYSLAGITISFGLMIDNTIVMLDHIIKHRNRKIFLPVLASTLTTIGALLSIYLLSNDLQQNMIDFALVIIVNLGISLFIGLWFIPAAVAIIKPDKKDLGILKTFSSIFYNVYEASLPYLIRFKPLIILLFLLLLGTPVFMLPNHSNGKAWYDQIYNKTIGSQWYNDKARPVVDKYLGGSLRLFSTYVFERAFYRQNEETKLMVLASMERAASMEQMNEVMLQLENYLRQFPEIKSFTSQIYSSDYAQIEIRFKHPDAGFPYILKSKLISKALDWGGMNWQIYGVGQGFNNTNAHSEMMNFVIKAKAYNLNSLNRWIDSLQNNLRKHPRVNKIIVSSREYPGFRPRLQYIMKLNKDFLALQNITGNEIYQTLQGKTLSEYASDFIQIDEKSYPLRLQASDQDQYDIWHIMNEPILLNNQLIKLNKYATIYKKKMPDFIRKENKNYLKNIFVKYVGSEKFGKKAIQKKIHMLESKLPLGMTFELKTNNWSWTEKKESWISILGFIILIIFLISAILFESFKQALVVLSIIPVSFTGVFLTFYLFDFDFDQGGMASFILLSGITVNAVFYILNQYNFYVSNERLSPKTAFIHALKDMLFPISLTILSTVLGFLPFVINGQKEIFWFALGIGTMGGILFSFLGLILLLPVLIIKKNKPVQIIKT